VFPRWPAETVRPRCLPQRLALVLQLDRAAAAEAELADACPREVRRQPAMPGVRRPERSRR